MQTMISFSPREIHPLQVVEELLGLVLFPPIVVLGLELRIPARFSTTPVLLGATVKEWIPGDGREGSPREGRKIVIVSRISKMFSIRIEG